MCLLQQAYYSGLQKMNDFNIEKSYYVYLKF